MSTWQNYYEHLQKLGVLEDSEPDILERFFSAASKLNFHSLPSSVIWSENSFFTLSWFEHDLLIVCDREKVEIVKLPGPFVKTFDNDELCISYLLQNYEVNQQKL
jgi:hypothetical protein